MIWLFTWLVGFLATLLFLVHVVRPSLTWSWTDWIVAAILSTLWFLVWPFALVSVGWAAWKRRGY